MKKREGSSVASKATAALAAALALAVYLITLAPSVGAGHDSGELATACTVLGIPHPPGYPLYVLLGHLFTHLPFGEAAWRVNLFSACAMALGIGFLAAALSLRVGPASALAAALVYAFALTSWQQAVVAEVFALHLCLLSALLWIALRWEAADDDNRPRLVRQAALVLGLACAHHHTVALALPGLALFGLLARGRGRRWGFSAKAVLLLVSAALTPYVLMALRSMQDPAMDWGDPSSPARLAAHVLRHAYGSSFALNVFSGEEGATWPIHLYAYASSLIREQLPGIVFLPALAGVVVAWCSQRATALLLMSWILVCGPLFAVLGNQPDNPFFADLLQRFFAASFLGWAGFLAYGLGRLESALEATRLGPARWLLLLLPALSLSLNFPRASLAGQYHPVDYAAGVLEQTPRDALLVVSGDLNVGATDYLQLVQGLRPDLTTIKPGLVGTAWYQAQLPAALADVVGPTRGRNLPSQAALMQHFRASGREVYLNYAESRIPGLYLRRGLVWRYLLPDENPPSAEEETAAARATLEALERQPRRGDYRDDPRRNFWERYYISHWVDAYRNTAASLAGADAVRAAACLERVVEMHPASVQDWLDLGWQRLASGRAPLAEEAFRRAALLAPHHPDVQTGLAAVSATGPEPESR